MKSTPFKTALIGLGKMGMQNAQDPKIAQYYKYSSHIQAINDHPDFECDAFYDQNRGVDNQNFVSIDEMVKDYKPDILVLATPPKGRLDIVQKFHGLKAVVMEKPVAYSTAEAQEIVSYCEERGILLQINFWRRFDPSVLALKKTIIENKENPQVIFMTYGNGFRNNAVHLIDQVRYLFGEIDFAQALSEKKYNGEFPIDGDFNMDFMLKLKGGGDVYVHALDFKHYRQIGIDIWTDQRRIEFLQSALLQRIAPVKSHRALDSVSEVANDQAVVEETGAGLALYGLYDNLSCALHGKETLYSDGFSALENERILDMIAS